jgi:hypothetical protein
LSLAPGIFRVRHDIGNVNYFGLERGPPSDTPSIRWTRMLPEEFLKFGRKAIACGDMVEFAFT